ncbi:MAG TPA: hypothetical protein VLX85_05060, partial [Stellaceae bacterium]|nr:hypothetical protein [Stellaceae bacterium]
VTLSRHGGAAALAGLAASLSIPVLVTGTQPGSLATHRAHPLPFLQKPFRIAELESRVRELLRERG